ncbi:uncharacterized protein LOC109789219 [Cajanus cajan]|uniref:uncharacterized protein LOC109789219 n=1 Tax=Cajanus cajan TaxID=3821 RepID=UPI00098DA8D0|nr:uncharacterized protein LOC109789219 [Cajanus cajan]
MDGESLHESPAPRPPEPLDVGVHRHSSVSFRDKLIGNKEAAPRPLAVDLIRHNLFRIEFEDGNRLKPKCFISDEVLQPLREPWQEAVVIKLLGKSVGFFTMKEKLRGIWKLAGGYDVLDIGHGFFLVKFDMQEDRDKVITGGPWMMFDHYLAVREWVPDFVAAEVRIDKALVWIRFPSLGMEYYDESVLLALATAVGRPVKVDFMTMNATRGKFARVCVEIDLNEPVVGKVWFRNVWFKIEYEGLHLLCAKCGRYGHVARQCAVQGLDGVETEGEVPREAPLATAVHSHTQTVDSAADGVHEDWMVVMKFKRGGKSKGVTGGENKWGYKGGDSQFKFKNNPFQALRREMDMSQGPMNADYLNTTIFSGTANQGSTPERHFVDLTSKVWTKSKGKRSRHEPAESTEEGSSSQTLAMKKTVNCMKSQTVATPLTSIHAHVKTGMKPLHTHMQPPCSSYVQSFGDPPQSHIIPQHAPRPPDDALPADGVTVGDDGVALEEDMDVGEDVTPHSQK